MCYSRSVVVASLYIIATVHHLFYCFYFMYIELSLLYISYVSRLVIILYLVFSAFGAEIFEPRVFRKQPLYLYEVVVRSAYTLPSPDPTCGISLGMLLLLL